MVGYLIGRFRFLSSLGEYISLIVDVFAAAFRRPPHWRLLADQLYNIGVLSLPVVAMTGFSTGLVLAAQSFFQLADKGLASATGIMVAKAMITELGPVLTAFMVTGRVGAAMCAELGTMKVTEQVDALQTMAVNPNRYLIAPRFMAGTIMMPLLTVFSIIMGIFGGYLIAVYYFGMSPNTYLEPLPQYVTFFDFFMGIVKSFIFGVFIVTICCFKGIKTTGGAEGVRRSTTNSLVICYTCILFGNFLITVALNHVQDKINQLFV